VKNKFINKRIDYTGEQLSSHFAYRNFDLQGDSVVSFIGACDVKEKMVDLEDSKKKEFIHSDLMLHFLAEHFDCDLEKAILRKRLLIAIMLEEICKYTKKRGLIRSNNGIYMKDEKLTVAIATISPVSTLIHAGLNISSKNTPVKTIGLFDLGIKPEMLADKVMKRYCDEMGSAALSKTKVKGVS
jgi:hypothetical protein